MRTALPLFLFIFIISMTFVSSVSMNSDKYPIVNTQEENTNSLSGQNKQVAFFNGLNSITGTNIFNYDSLLKMLTVNKLNLTDVGECVDTTGTTPYSCQEFATEENICNTLNGCVWNGTLSGVCEGDIYPNTLNETICNFIKGISDSCYWAVSNASILVNGVPLNLTGSSSSTMNYNNIALTNKTNTFSQDQVTEDLNVTGNLTHKGQYVGFFGGTTPSYAGFSGNEPFTRILYYNTYNYTGNNFEGLYVYVDNTPTTNPGTAVLNGIGGSVYTHGALNKYDIRGLSFFNYNDGSGNITNWYGAYNYLYQNGVGSKVTNAYINYANLLLGSGTYGSVYGYYVASLKRTGVDNGYAFVNEGANDFNKFVGNTTFGADSRALNEKVKIMGLMRQTTGESFLTNLTLTDDGALNLSGAAMVFNDVVAPLTVAHVGATAPSFNENQKAYGFEDGVNEQYAFVSLQLPHWYYQGSDISCHIHVRPDGTQKNNVTFQMNYTWINVGDSAGSNGLLQTSQNFSSGITNNNTIIEFADISGTGKKISSSLLVKLTRRSNNASDTYTGTVFVDFFDCHVQQDSLGSKTEYGK